MLDNFLWVEKYRPKTIEETVLPKSTKSIFQKFVDQKKIPNMILSGTAGVGKTTVARAMLEELGCDYIIINGSMDGNIDTLRTKILNFAASVSFSGGRKYVILDEADYLNANSTQPALRNFMEEFSANCGFILTCNYVNRIIEPLHSRCSIVDFKINKKDKEEMFIEAFKRLRKILKEENIPNDKEVLVSLLQKYFPDFRRCINELQRYSATGKIDTGILSNFVEVSLGKLIKAMREKDFTSVRKWVSDNSDMEVNSFFRKLYDVSNDQFTPIGVAQLVLILAKYQYQSAFVVDQEINTSALCVEIMMDVEFR